MSEDQSIPPEGEENTEKIQQLQVENEENTEEAQHPV